MLKYTFKFSTVSSPYFFGLKIKYYSRIVIHFSIYFFLYEIIHYVFCILTFLKNKSLMNNKYVWNWFLNVVIIFKCFQINEKKRYTRLILCLLNNKHVTVINYYILFVIQNLILLSNNLKKNRRSRLWFENQYNNYIIRNLRFSLNKFQNIIIR